MSLESPEPLWFERPRARAPDPVVEIAAATHRGRARAVNEDAAGVDGWAVVEGGVAVMRRSLTAPVCCCVADGAGGHPAGDRASALAVRSLMAQAPGMRSTAAVADAIEHAHRALHQEMTRDPACRGMATTVAVVLATGSDVIIANVGDSPVYDITRGAPLAMTTDDRAELPEWAPAGATTAVVSQLLGGYEERAVPVAHVDRCAPEDGLRLLLCTDGVGAVLDEDDLADVIDAAAHDAAAVEAIVRAVLEGGAPDNVTAMIARIHAPRGGP